MSAPGGVASGYFGGAGGGGAGSLWNAAAYLQQQQGGFMHGGTAAVNSFPHQSQQHHGGSGLTSPGLGYPPFPQTNAFGFAAQQQQPPPPPPPAHLAHMMSSASMLNGGGGATNAYHHPQPQHLNGYAGAAQTNGAPPPANPSRQQLSLVMRPMSAMTSGSCSPSSFPTMAAPTPSPPTGATGDTSTTGVGTLFWLSSQAGLIRVVRRGDTTETPPEGQDGDTAETVVSFQLKDFCDQAVHDLTSVLRPGFTLKFQAMVPARAGGGSSSWIATFVAPVHGADATALLADDTETNLEAPPGVETGPPQLPKDAYALEQEAKAVPMLLDIFEKNQQPQCQLSVIHCHISNCGDERLYHYVGTSSLKRRQFLERRTHIFHINQSDWVSLQPAEVHTTVTTLTRRLLRKGGACLTQDLFDHYCSCPEIPLEARELIGEGKTQFLHFLQSHPWIFSVFPSRVFVSVRRNFPKLDYQNFINEHFADFELRPNGGGCSPPVAAAASTPTNGNAAAYATQQQHQTAAMLHHHVHPQQQMMRNPPPPLPPLRNGAVNGGWFGVKDGNKDAGLPPPAATPTFGGGGGGSGLTTPGSASMMMAPAFGAMSLGNCNASNGGGGTSSSSGVYSGGPSTPSWTTPMDAGGGGRQTSASFWNAGNAASINGAQQQSMMMNAASAAAAEARVGGRIKRFTDIETQTTATSTSPPPPSVYGRPAMVDACVQTNVEMVTTGSGPQDPTAAVKHSSTTTSESEIASDTDSNANSDNSLFGGGAPAENGAATSAPASTPSYSAFGGPAAPGTGARCVGGGFNPLLDSWTGLGEQLRMNFGPASSE